jgi:predicted lipoprotein with Yx(FWY)xxD motif
MQLRPMRHVIALILALSMTAMGYAAATARGQTTAGGQVLVLCSGGGLVQVTLDRDGKPTGQSHLCPDLASGLLAAFEMAPPVVVRPAAAGVALVQPAPALQRSGHAPDAARARGPPVRI